MTTFAHRKRVPAAPAGALASGRQDSSGRGDESGVALDPLQKDSRPASIASSAW